MRSLTSATFEAAMADVISPIFLFKGEFDSGNVCFWAGYGNLSYDSEIYTGAGDFLNYSEVIEKLGTEVTTINIKLAGTNAAMRSIAMNEDYQGRILTISLGFLRLTNKSFVFQNQEQYLLQNASPKDSNIISDTELVADPYILFYGKMDVLNFNQTVQNGELAIILDMTAESMLSKLGASAGSNYPAENQKSYYAGDKGFDFMPMLQNKEVVWGRR